jgi:hypothetical protein
MTYSIQVGNITNPASMTLAKEAFELERNGSLPPNKAKVVD